MKTYRYHYFTLAILCTVLSLLTGNQAMAIEKAKYDVVESDLEFEIRRYAPQIVAETFVEGEFEKVGNEGFRRLYDYISGNNRKKESISMTAPVTQEGESQKIAMTAPVNQVRENNKWRITFLMPSNYSMEELPEPLDDRVVLKEDPERIFAAIKYSGTWSKARYVEKKSLLEDFIAGRGLKVSGEAIWARYDPPFMPWFLRRNEVLIPIEN
ncbi:MAG: heme-binding protein [Desulfobacterales bacterium]|nr:heme-binding protein [Desulfobacterales bacterium]